MCPQSYLPLLIIVDLVLDRIIIGLNRDATSKFKCLEIISRQFSENHIHRTFGMRQFRRTFKLNKYCCDWRPQRGLWNAAQLVSITQFISPSSIFLTFLAAIPLLLQPKHTFSITNKIMTIVFLEIMKD